MWCLNGGVAQSFHSSPISFKIWWGGWKQIDDVKWKIKCYFHQHLSSANHQTNIYFQSKRGGGGQLLPPPLWYSGEGYSVKLLMPLSEPSSRPSIHEPLRGYTLIPNRIIPGNSNLHSYLHLQLVKMSVVLTLLHWDFFLILWFHP